MNKIEDALPIPTHCDNCGSSNIELTTNDKIYGRQYGKWPLIYYCKKCRAMVGCHKGTEIPLGKMADRSTRQLRVKAHSEFDKLWRTGLISRKKAYEWLARELGIPAEECHISWLTRNQLIKATEISAEYFSNNEEILIKRKVKQDAKQEKRKARANAARQRSAAEVRKRKAKRRT